MTPNEITVLIEGDDSETTAKFISYSEEYKASLYRTEDGREFYVDPELITESKDNHKAVPIPLQVITHREKMLAKLAWAQDTLNRIHKEQTSGLVLPDGQGV